MRILIFPHRLGQKVHILHGKLRYLRSGRHWCFIKWVSQSIAHHLLESCSLLSPAKVAQEASSQSDPASRDEKAAWTPFKEVMVESRALFARAVLGLACSFSEAHVPRQSEPQTRFRNQWRQRVTSTDPCQKKGLDT